MSQTVPIGVSFSRSQVAALLATVVDFGLLILLKEVFLIWYVLATALGALAGAITNFYINRQWSFRALGSKWNHQATRYAVVSIGSLGFNTLGVWMMTENIKTHYTLSKVVIALAVGVLYNFPLHRFWVFKEKRKEPQ